MGPRALDHLFVRLMDRCNLECAHCYASCGPRAPDGLELPLVLSLLDQLADFEVKHLHLEGGEALIYPGIWEVLDRLGSLGIRPAITSNGLRFDPDLAERLAGRVARLTFSVDGPSADTHDQIRRRQGSFERVVRAIRCAKAAGIQTHMISVVWKRTADHVDRIVELAEELGVDRLLLFACGRIGAATRNWEELACDDATWARYLARVRGLARTRPWVWFELDRVPRDRLAEYLPADYRPPCTRRPRPSITIDPKGDVYVCGYFIPSGKSLGNIRKAPLEEIVDRSQVEVRLSGACRDPWAERGEMVELCKVFSVNEETLPRV